MMGGADGRCVVPLPGRWGGVSDGTGRAGAPLTSTGLPPPPLHRPPSRARLWLGPVGGRTAGAAVTAARARDSPVDRDGSRRRHVTEARRICRGQCLRADSPSAFAGSARCCSPHNSLRHVIRSSDILAGVMDLSLRFAGTPICP